MNDDRLAELSATVNQVIAKGIGSYFRESEQSPILRRLVREIYGDNGSDIYESIKTLFRDACDRIEDEERARASKKLLLAEGSLKQRRDAARREFGKDGYPNWHPEYDTFRTGKRYEPAIREELPKILQRMESEGLQIDLRPPHEGDSSYIQRKELEDEFLRLRRQEGKRLFLLWGEPGMGKTMLASELASKSAHSPASIIRLELEDENTLVGKIADYLKNRTTDGHVPSGHAALIMRRFAHSLIAPNAPSVVILDAASAWDSVRLLLPEEKELNKVQSLIIVTAREDIFPSNLGSRLFIDSMTKPEAVEMVKSRVDEISEADAESLAEELDYRPLAIEHACALLRESDDEPVQDFFAMLRIDIVERLDAVNRDTKMTAIYRRIIEKLSGDPESVLAWRLLQLVLSSAIHSTDIRILSHMWVEQYLVPSPNSRNQKLAHKLAEKSVRSALKRLEALAIVKYHERSKVVSMHNLTYRILRGLVELPPSTELVLKSVRNYLDTIDWMPGQLLPHRATHWLGDLDVAFASLFKTAISPDFARQTLLPRSLAFFLRCARQAGDPSLLNAVTYAEYIYERLSPHRDDVLEEAMKALAIELLSSGAARSLIEALIEEKQGGSPKYSKGIGQILQETRQAFLYDADIGDTWYPIQRIYDPDWLMESLKTALSSTKTTENATSYAHLQQFKGTYLCDTGAWAEAEQCFEASFRSLVDGGDPESTDELYNIQLKSFALETVRRVIELHLVTNDNASLRRWTERLSLLQNGEPWSSIWIDDKLLDLRLRSTEANLKLHYLYRSGLENNKSDLVTTALDLATLYEQLVEDHLRSGFLSTAPSLFYGFSRARILDSPCFAEQILTRLHQLIHDVKFDYLCPLARIALIKCYLPHAHVHNGVDSSIMNSHIEEALHWGNHLKHLNLFHYWQAEAFVVAYVLARVNRGSDSELWQQARSLAAESLDRIGRLDRLALAEGVISGELSSVLLFAD